jgi:hypothetical protein
LVIRIFDILDFTEIREYFLEVAGGNIAGQSVYENEELIVVQILGQFYGGF